MTQGKEIKSSFVPLQLVTVALVTRTTHTSFSPFTQLSIDEKVGQLRCFLAEKGQVTFGRLRELVILDRVRLELAN